MGEPQLLPPLLLPLDGGPRDNPGSVSESSSESDESDSTLFSCKSECEKELPAVVFDVLVLRLDILAALVDSQLEFGGVKLEGVRLEGVRFVAARLERTFFQENGSLLEEVAGGSGERFDELGSGSVLIILLSRPDDIWSGTLDSGIRSIRGERTGKFS